MDIKRCTEECMEKIDARMSGFLTRPQCTLQNEPVRICMFFHRSKESMVGEVPSQ